MRRRMGKRCNEEIKSYKLKKEEKNRHVPSMFPFQFFVSFRKSDEKKCNFGNFASLLVKRAECKTNNELGD